MRVRAEDSKESKENRRSQKLSVLDESKEKRRSKREAKNCNLSLTTFRRQVFQNRQQMSQNIFPKSKNNSKKSPGRTLRGIPWQLGHHPSTLQGPPPSKVAFFIDFGIPGQSPNTPFCIPKWRGRALLGRHMGEEPKPETCAPAVARAYVTNLEGSRGALWNPLRRSFWLYLWRYVFAPFFSTRTLKNVLRL